MSLTRFFEYNFRTILFCQLHDLKHKINYIIFYVYRADIVNFEKISSSMSIILSYRCNVGVSLVVPLVVFNSTSYTQDLRFYLVQTNESLTNPRIWHMTAVSCQIINLKVASIYKVYARNFLSITLCKFILHHSRDTCQLYTSTWIWKKKPQKLLNFRHTVWNI